VNPRRSLPWSKKAGTAPCVVQSGRAGFLDESTACLVQKGATGGTGSLRSACRGSELRAWSIFLRIRSSQAWAASVCVTGHAVNRCVGSSVLCSLQMMHSGESWVLRNSWFFFQAFCSARSFLLSSLISFHCALVISFFFFFAAICAFCFFVFFFFCFCFSFAGKSCWSSAERDDVGGGLS
jgi:hypothetical protein